MSRETPTGHGEDNGHRRHWHLEAQQRQACQGHRREDDRRMRSSGKSTAKFTVRLTRRMGDLRIEVKQEDGGH